MMYRKLKTNAYHKNVKELKNKEKCNKGPVGHNTVTKIRCEC